MKAPPPQKVKGEAVQEFELAFGVREKIARTPPEERLRRKQAAEAAQLEESLPSSRVQPS